MIPTLERLPYYPVARVSPPHPMQYTDEAGESAPVIRARLWNDDPVWLVTRYDDARSVLQDSETFSQVPEPGYPTTSPGRAEVVAKDVPTFVRLNPPEQTLKRRMVAAEFTAKSVNAKRPRMVELANTLVDRMLARGRTADLFADYAVPFPTTVITEHLGLPSENIAFTQRMAFIKQSLDVDGETAREAQLALGAYLDEQMRLKEREPGDDVISRLIANHVATGRMSWEEAIYTVELLLVAGLETTVNMISVGTLVLLQHPEQWERLRADRSLLPAAISELLRYLTVHQSITVTGRLCKKDTVIAGQPVAAGDGVFVVLPMANRDPSVFPDPNRFDITRDASGHLAFGYGSHQCLGMALARAEMEIAFSTLLDRIPDLRLAVPVDQVPFKHAAIFGVDALPVAW